MSNLVALQRRYETEQRFTQKLLAEYNDAHNTLSHDPAPEHQQIRSEIDNALKTHGLMHENSATMVKNEIERQIMQQNNPAKRAFEERASERRDSKKRQLESDRAVAEQNLKEQEERIQKNRETLIYQREVEARRQAAERAVNARNQELKEKKIREELEKKQQDELKEKQRQELEKKQKEELERKQKEEEKKRQEQKRQEAKSQPEQKRPQGEGKSEPKEQKKTEEKEKKETEKTKAEREQTEKEKAEKAAANLKSCNESFPSMQQKCMVREFIAAADLVVTPNFVQDQFSGISTYTHRCVIKILQALVLRLHHDKQTTSSMTALAMEVSKSFLSNYNFAMAEMKKDEKYEQAMFILFKNYLRSGIPKEAQERASEEKNAFRFYEQQQQRQQHARQQQQSRKPSQPYFSQAESNRRTREQYQERQSARQTYAQWAQQEYPAY